VDLWKLVFVILMVVALVAAIGWFVSNGLDVVVDSGAAARLALSAGGGPIAAWSVMSKVMGPTIAGAFTLAWSIAGAALGVFFVVRLTRWVNGA